VEAVHYYLQQIEANQHLNSFLEVYAEEALAQAAQLDKSVPMPNQWRNYTALL